MSNNANRLDSPANNQDQESTALTADKDVLINRMYADLSESNRRYNLAVDAWRSLQEKYMQMHAQITSLTTSNEDLAEQKKSLESEKSQMHAQVTDLTNSNEDLAEQKKNWESEKKILENRLAEAEASLKKMTKNLVGMKAREQQWLGRNESLKNSISFRLGASILNAGKSWKGAFKLPGEILHLIKDARQRRAKRRQKLTGQAPVQITRSWDFRKPAGDKLRIAAIMDEFTCQCYAPECTLLELSPDTWQQQMQDFHPDVLFVESAWQGKDGAWKQKVSNFLDPVPNLLAWCRKAGIPSIFWNKEDPVHYGAFLPLARAADVVFTTDIDCIPLYKRDLGHDHVYLLPFAAQPAIHNPVEKYERQHKFCFAGSYYLRYPERQRDFAMLMETLARHSGIDIYDRNFDNPHPHYSFPDIYRPYIIGKLPYAEIDRAYKGYDFGINMNTGKQSQSMFARRVYEMAASNTVVVSNFSRGMRNFFGDLVISGDDGREIERRLRPVVEDKSLYRKLRLKALRHVLAHHTYRHRLEYIREKLWTLAPAPEPLVCLIAFAKDQTEANLLCGHFLRQNYIHKELWLISSDTESQHAMSPGIHIVSDFSACREALASCKADFLGLLQPDHWYGPYYLTDLLLTREYSSASVFGKATYYEADSGSVKLIEDGCQYRKTESLPVWACVCRTTCTDIFWDALKEGQDRIAGDCFAIDEFNFIAHGACIDSSLIKVADDLVLADTGVDFAGRILPLSEKITLSAPVQTYPDPGAREFAACEMAQIFKSKSSKLRFTDAGEALQIDSSLSVGKHAYSCDSPCYSREELNLVTNSTVSTTVTGSLNLQICFTFLDAEQQKLSHTIVRPFQTTLVVPEECQYIKISLRMEGPGRAMLKPLHFGQINNQPSALLCHSSTLVLAKQYPAYNDLYKYGFLHSRLAAYRKEGVITDMFRMQPANTFYREFEGIDVATGDARLLDATLASGQISHVCVHLLDRAMWTVLKKYLDTVRVTIWIHGAEIQHWKRREFEFVRMNAEEIAKQKKRTTYALQLWKEILSLNHKNVHYVFVSDWFRKECEEDVGTSFPPERYTIIHNYINGDEFPYKQKNPEDRFRILSIRPYSALTYSNDLTIATILNLSKRDGFDRYSFTLVGDGPLFDETVSPVAHLPNVHLEKRFLNHSEMREYFSRNGIFLVPTRMDSQGVSRDEAMSAGLVPVTTAVCAIPEFTDESCACLAPAEDSVAMADGIEKLADAPDLFLSMSQNAAAQVRRLSGFKQTIGRELQLLKGPENDTQSRE